MVDWLETPGFGDRARRDGDATHVPPDAETRRRAGERIFWRLSEPEPEPELEPEPEPEPDDDDDDEPSPMFTAVAAAGVAGFVVTAWFLLLSLFGAGHWSAAEVTAPLWGLVLVGAAATLAVTVVLGTLDAWDAHCLRRADRKARRP